MASIVGCRIMRTIIAISLLAFTSACSYSHIGTTSATFNQMGPASAGEATQSGPLVLKFARHVDTVMRGPDTEEDQVLVLHVRDFRLNQRLAIPSDNVTAEFTVTRFGPHSEGDSYKGYLIIKKISRNQVTAYVHLDVTARTESGSYVQTAKFHGEYQCFREADLD
jgi:hypothetical protein